MTDLEMTKLCAEAMGIEIDGPLMDQHGQTLQWHFKTDNGTTPHYDPLLDDAQAMALVKRFQLDIEPMFSDDEGEWRVSRWLENNATRTGGIMNADLNRAILECVAKMRELERC